LGNDRVSIGLGIVEEHISNNELKDKPATYKLLSESQFVSQLPDLYHILGKYGYKIPEYYYFTSYCMIAAKHSFILHPSGDLYKCLCFVGREEYICGNIFDENTHNCYFSEELYRQCISRNCCFLPICHTGCRYRALVKYGDLMHIDCRRHLLEEINKRLIMKNMEI